MATLITDEMIETIAVWGTPDQVAAEIVQRFGDCDRICAYFPYSTRATTSLPTSCRR